LWREPVENVVAGTRLGLPGRPKLRGRTLDPRSGAKALSRIGEGRAADGACDVPGAPELEKCRLLGFGRQEWRVAGYESPSTPAIP